MGGVNFKKSLFSLLLGFSLATTTFAAHDVTDLFEEHFEKNYQSRKCGQNIEAFARAIKKTHGDVDGFYVVSIVNKGFSVFGMVNAEKARSERFRKPAEDEVNWYHHVVLLDDGGKVYDFDYGIEPKVMSFDDYIEHMFLDEEECRTGAATGEFCVGRDTKLKEYEFESLDAESVLAKDRKRKAKKARMAAVLKNWKVLLQ